MESIEALLDAIGQPVILVFHSGMASIGWRVADGRSKLVKGIVAAEPVGQKTSPRFSSSAKPVQTFTPPMYW